MTINEKGARKSGTECQGKEYCHSDFGTDEGSGKDTGKGKGKAKEHRLMGCGSINLFRISWKNQPVKYGGLYNEFPNYIEIPKEITGIKARIFAMSGKFSQQGHIR